LTSISSSAPVVSPTATIETTILGKMSPSPSGSENFEPCSMRVRIFRMKASIVLFPDEAAQIFNASIMLTPDVNIDAMVLQKRPTATLRKRLPNPGSFSRRTSKLARP